MAALADPLIGMRGGPPNVGSLDTNSSRGMSQSSSPTNPMSGMGGICSEDIRVPDKMVGLSKWNTIFPANMKNEMAPSAVFYFISYLVEEYNYLYFLLVS